MGIDEALPHASTHPSVFLLELGTRLAWAMSPHRYLLRTVWYNWCLCCAFTCGLQAWCSHNIFFFWLRGNVSASPSYQVFDESALSQRCKEEMYKCYPDAKRAHLKSGGNFPYLSRSSEVNLMLQVSSSSSSSFPGYSYSMVADPQRRHPNTIFANWPTWGGLLLKFCQSTHP